MSPLVPDDPRKDPDDPVEISCPNCEGDGWLECDDGGEVECSCCLGLGSTTQPIYEEWQAWREQQRRIREDSNRDYSFRWQVAEVKRLSDIIQALIFVWVLTIPQQLVAAFWVFLVIGAWKGWTK